MHRGDRKCSPWLYLAIVLSGLVEQYSTCLESVRPRVQPPVPPKIPNWDLNLYAQIFSNCHTVFILGTPFYIPTDTTRPIKNCSKGTAKRVKGNPGDGRNAQGSTSRKSAEPLQLSSSNKTWKNGEGQE
jgi:hypothetical protein